MVRSDFVTTVLLDSYLHSRSVNSSGLQLCLPLLRLFGLSLTSPVNGTGSDEARDSSGTSWSEPLVGRAMSAKVAGRVCAAKCRVSCGNSVWDRAGRLVSASIRCCNDACLKIGSSANDCSCVRSGTRGMIRICGLIAWRSAGRLPMGSLFCVVALEFGGGRRRAFGICQRLTETKLRRDSAEWTHSDGGGLFRLATPAWPWFAFDVIDGSMCSSVRGEEGGAG